MSSKKAVRVRVERVTFEQKGVIQINGTKKTALGANAQEVKFVTTPEGKRMFVSNNLLRAEMYRDAHPRAALTGEEKLSAADITTNPGILCRGHFINADQAIKRETCFFIQHAIDQNVTVREEYETNARSTPASENSEIGEDGEFIDKGGKGFFQRPVYGTTSLNSSLYIDLRKAQFINHDDKTGGRSFDGNVGDKNLRNSDSLPLIKEMLHKSLKKAGLETADEDVKVGIYEYGGMAGWTMSQRGVLLSDNVVSWMAQDILNRVQKVNVIRSKGMLRCLGVGEIYVDLEDGTSIRVDDPGQLQKVLTEVGVKEFFKESTVEPVAAAFSQDLSDKRKAERNAVKEEIASRKRAKKEKAS